MTKNEISEHTHLHAPQRSRKHQGWSILTTSPAQQSTSQHRAAPCTDALVSDVHVNRPLAILWLYHQVPSLADCWDPRYEPAPRARNCRTQNCTCKAHQPLESTSFGPFIRPATSPPRWPSMAATRSATPAWSFRPPSPSPCRRPTSCHRRTRFERAAHHQRHQGGLLKSQPDTAQRAQPARHT